MTALIIIGCILLFFTFLLSLKAKITIAYSEEFSLYVNVLFFKLKIFPKKEKKGPHSISASKARRLRKKITKKDAKKKEAQKEKEEKKKQRKLQHKSESKKSVSEILEIITLIRKLVAKVVQRFFKHLRIDIARLKIKVATGDAASTAIAYGAVTQSVNLLLPILEDVKNFKLPDTSEIDIYADFTAESPEADIILSFSLRVWHVFDIAFGALKTFIKHKLSTNQSGK